VKFTLSWLRTHLETEASLAQIAETLNAIGIEVESVADPAAALAPFRIAYVREAKPHPNADRLKVCEVDLGEGAPISVVCGAPNARTGMKAVFAPPGSVIPGTGMMLKIGDIRGVKSAGMLLSAYELGLGDDHSGIVALPDDAPVGMAYAQWAGLDDPVMEVAVTPNRGDALGVRGIARDLAAAGLGHLREWNAEPVASRFPSPVRWRIEWPEACPFVLGRAIRGVRNHASPKWLADRLRAVGLRPINALVDITNFFTIDLGRPLHVFDISKLSGNLLTMRQGRGETFRALNGRDILATEEDCVIADAAGAQSLAGIIGGETTGCDENTTEVFIECALFDPVRIALTGRRLQIASDARQRFERGVDPALMEPALEAATHMVLELCGGEPSTVVAAGELPDWRRCARLRFARIREFGGAEVASEETVAILQRLGFAVEEQTADEVRVQVPSWRHDVAAPIVLDQAPGLPPAKAEQAASGVAEIEAECDLIEEVLRIRGLDKVPARSLPPLAPVPAATLSPTQARTALARRVLAARGLVECVTFSFIAQNVAALFGATPASLSLCNPIAADLDIMRPSPLPSLALAASRNAARGFPDGALFEVGPGFLNDSPEGQLLIAAGLRTGATPRNWREPARPVEALDAKADALALLAVLGVASESLKASPDAPEFYHPGRSGLLRLGPKMVLARFGELHPMIVERLDLPRPAVAFEVFLEALPAPKRGAKIQPDLSPFQPVRRDFAFVVDEAVPAETVLRAAREAEGGVITSVVLFDLYAGEQLPAGKKSLAIEVTFQPRERTFTDAEIESFSEKVINAVIKASGGRLRG